jgi:hypothetical protein
MAIPIILALKGLAFLGKAIAGKAILVKATSVVLLKSVAAFGLSSTISTTLVVGTAVGGILWTKGEIKHLKKAFRALEEDQLDEAILHFASLMNAIRSIHAESLADTVHTCLQWIGVSNGKANEVYDLIVEMGDEITQKARQLK